VSEGLLLDTQRGEHVAWTVSRRMDWGHKTHKLKWLSFTYNDFMCGLSGDSDILGYVDEINCLW